jgi:hypothetical protein
MVAMPLHYRIGNIVERLGKACAKIECPDFPGRFKDQKFTATQFFT